MENGGGHHERFGLPENTNEQFDEHALEAAIRANRQREFEALAELNS